MCCCALGADVALVARTPPLLYGWARRVEKASGRPDAVRMRMCRLERVYVYV
jgi:hypothetical protein